VLDSWRRQYGPFVEFSFDKINRDLQSQVLRDSRRALLWTAAAILLIVYLTFRNLRITLLVLMPIVFAIVVTFGLLRLCGNHSFSFMSVTAIPLIIGIGIDNGIHLVRRYLERIAQQHSRCRQGLGRGADSIQPDHHHRLWRAAGGNLSAAGRNGTGDFAGCCP
jgi:preprotein translocase subunit SecF